MRSPSRDWFRLKYLSEWNWRPLRPMYRSLDFWCLQLEATTAKTGRRLPLMDNLLAATALARDLTLVTRNVADFKAAGVPHFDPWMGN